MNKKKSREKMSNFQHNNGNKQIVDLTDKIKFWHGGSNATILRDQDSSVDHKYLYIDKYLLSTPIVTIEVLNESTWIVHTANNAYLVAAPVASQSVNKDVLSKLRTSIVDEALLCS